MPNAHNGSIFATATAIAAQDNRVRKTIKIIDI